MSYCEDHVELARIASEFMEGRYTISEFTTRLEIILRNDRTGSAAQYIAELIFAA
jgi:septum formation topological specificity factor MinE